MKKQQRRKGRRYFFRRYKLWILLIVVVATLVLAVGNWSSALAEKVSTEKQNSDKVGQVERIVERVEEATPKGVFYQTVFLGNSYVETLKTYHMPEDADFISRVGLTVESAFTKDLVNTDTTAMEALGEKNYKRVFLVFGENELGWSYSQVFITKYQDLIAAVKKQLPQAEIYVMGILPVTDEISAKNEDQTNNERIEEYNALLATMAPESGAIYVAPPEGVQTDYGSLKEDASTDGIHLNAAYSEIWVEDLRSLLEGK